MSDEDTSTRYDVQFYCHQTKAWIPCGFSFYKDGAELLCSVETYKRGPSTSTRVVVNMPTMVFASGPIIPAKHGK